MSRDWGLDPCPLLEITIKFVGRAVSYTLLRHMGMVRTPRSGSQRSPRKRWKKKKYFSFEFRAIIGARTPVSGRLEASFCLIIANTLQDWGNTASRTFAKIVFHHQFQSSHKYLLFPLNDALCRCQPGAYMHIPRTEFSSCRSALHISLRQMPPASTVCVHSRRGEINEMA
jgi:hypothetical protein